MGMTIAEKIVARAAGLPEAHANEIHTVELDYLMSNDGTTHLTIDMYNNLKNPRIADVKKLVWIVDHNVPCDSPKTAASQKKMRDFAKANGITFYEGAGVCHQVMIENHVVPGQLIFGADSHTCAYGALGAFGTGVGCTDYLYGMVTGSSWVLVPETLRFNLTGALTNGATARDLILTIIGKIGANGANYHAMEFAGPGMASLTMSDRIAICTENRRHVSPAIPTPNLRRSMTSTSPPSSRSLQSPTLSTISLLSASAPASRSMKPSWDPATTAAWRICAWAPPSSRAKKSHLPSASWSCLPAEKSISTP